MAVVSPELNGRRGRRRTAAAVVVGLAGMMILAFVLGGCGDSSNQGTSASQLDDPGVGASGSISTVGGASGAGGTATTGSGQGNVLVDYTWDQCTTEMQQRYGDLATAQKVCSELQTSYGSSSRSQLPTILPQAEKSANVTPPPASGGGGGTSTPPSSGGSQQGTGWGEVEIVVPQGPAGGPQN